MDSLSHPITTRVTNLDDSSDSPGLTPVDGDQRKSMLFGSSSSNPTTPSRVKNGKFENVLFVHDRIYNSPFRGVVGPPNRSWYFSAPRGGWWSEHPF